MWGERVGWQQKGYQKKKKNKDERKNANTELNDGKRVKKKNTNLH